ncbi:hypothetical protein ACFQXA_23615 [Nocardiopsis composta]
MGAGTVHRHFPTKEGLLEAVLADRLDELVARAERRRDLTDPGGAFFALLTDVIESAGERGPLCDALRPDAGWPRTVLSAAVLRFEEALRDQLSAAQRSGAVRADVTAGEVRALIIGCVAMRASGSGGERMARAALRVLRAEGAPAGDVAAGGAPNRDAAPAPRRSVTARGRTGGAGCAGPPWRSAASGALRATAARPAGNGPSGAGTGTARGRSDAPAPLHADLGVAGVSKALTLPRRQDHRLGRGPKPSREGPP